MRVRFVDERPGSSLTLSFKQTTLVPVWVQSMGFLKPRYRLRQLSYEIAETPQAVGHHRTESVHYVQGLGRQPQLSGEVDKPTITKLFMHGAPHENRGPQAMQRRSS